jgi:hypothetical protein
VLILALPRAGAAMAGGSRAAFSKNNKNRSAARNIRENSG